MLVNVEFIQRTKWVIVSGHRLCTVFPLKWAIVLEWILETLINKKKLYNDAPGLFTVTLIRILQLKQRAVKV